MIQTAPPVRNKHLVRELDRGRIRELLLVAGLTFVLLLPLLLYVWYHMEWIAGGYELERLGQERMAMAEMGERLRIEKASLTSLARVEREARSRLGMVPATGGVILVTEPPASALAAAEPEAGSVEGERIARRAAKPPGDGR